MASFDTLVDDFEDGVLNTTLWSGSYGGPDEVGGRARVPCTTGYAGLKSASTYTLTGSSLVMHLQAPIPNGATTAVASVLVLTSTGGTDGGFIIDPAQSAIGLYLREGYADAGAVFLTYSPTDHAWLRFREAAGSVYWDTSPDGSTWTNRRTATAPAWAADTTLSFLIEGHRDAGTPDFIEVHSINAAAGQTVEGSASFTATGTLTAAGIRRQPGAAALDATGTLAAAGTLRARATAALDASGDLAAAGTRRASGAVAADATGTLTATGTRTVRGAAVLTASGSVAIAEAAIDYSITIGSPTLAWEAGAPWL